MKSSVASSTTTETTSTTTTTTFTTIGSSLWTASPSVGIGNSLPLQTDENLVVYSVNGSVVWYSGTWVAGVNAARCLTMLNSGQLTWTDSTGTLLWHKNP
ncbi:unnamed protein product [Didymodactylos carnosus]|uniref:Bulb-type lectin domain-containing protein n=1 Tax=Didymodactylos carnosus TaxID=1234261 RepID=A0A815V372_9BILA|nr:unnamed protein product [Didymodactylos carnosus]CAF1527332.1 unnamed protein product [Didymodactylos carnosus]CAF3570865.1 unnamed protein product [Didymodactylos carnosus]CAF4386438.1 unnamed protein product [Didymodactylos carnosus]